MAKTIRGIELLNMLTHRKELLAKSDLTRAVRKERLAQIDRAIDIVMQRDIKKEH